MLEVNAEHPLVKKLEGSVHFNDLAHILFDQAPQPPRLAGLFTFYLRAVKGALSPV